MKTAIVALALAAPGLAQVWETRAPLLTNNSETGVAELAGKMYVMGGYPPSGQNSAAVQVYDAATNSWSLTTPLPVALNHIMAAAVGGKVYVIGGHAVNGSGPFVDTVYAYDPTTTNWTQRAAMPTARSAGAAGVINGKIYVAGGRPPQGHDFAVYDPAANSWQVLPNLPTQRNHVGAGVINGKFYVVAGRTGAGFSSPQTGVLEIYDPVTNNWTNGAPLPVPRSGMNSVVAHGRLHVWGGESSAGIFDEHDVYDPSSNSWSSATPLPTAVHGVFGSALIGGWIHQPGGGTSVGGSSGSTLHQVYRTPQGATFCTAKAGLACGAPAVASSGEPSASAASGYVVSATPARGCRSGILLYNTLPAAPVPFQGGTLCIATNGLRRAGSTNSGGTNNACDGTFAIDMNAFAHAQWLVPDCTGAPSGTPPNQPAAYLQTPGTQIYAQFWGRDTQATGSFVSGGLTYHIGP